MNKKSNIDNAIARLQEKKNNRPQSIVQEATEQKKIGRPSFKISDVEYVKLGVKVQAETKKKMKLALLNKFEGKYQTQDEFVNDAILFFIDNKSI